MRKSVSAVLILAATCSSTIAVSSIQASTHFVPAEYDSIQTAIDSSVDGDTVLISPGTYVERINFNGKNLVVGSLMLTTGDDRYIRQTVIDGDSAGSVVTIPPGSDNRTKLSGLTIQRSGVTGTASGVFCDSSSARLEYLIVRYCGSTSGAGIYVRNCDANVRYSTLQDNTRGIYANGGHYSWLNFIDNYKTAFYASFGNPVVEDCYFEGNSVARSSAVIESRYTSGVFTRLVIQNNQGCGIKAREDTSIFQDIVVLNNQGSECWGAMMNNSTTRINRAIFAHNSSGDNRVGSAFKFDSESYPILSNLTVIAGENPGAALIWVNGHVWPVFVNCIIDRNGSELLAFWPSPGASFTFAFCCFPDSEGFDIREGDYLEWLEGNIIADADYVDREIGDFRLREDSPCIDAGVAQLDWRGLRILDIPHEMYAGRRPDIGWHEFGWANRVPFNNAPPIVPRLLANYPNPFNATTTLSFDIFTPGFVRLTVHDLSGAKITSLIEERLAGGNYRREWNAGNLPSGTYLLNLETAGQAVSRPIILVK